MRSLPTLAGFVLAALVATCATATRPGNAAPDFTINDNATSRCGYPVTRASSWSSNGPIPNVRSSRSLRQRQHARAAERLCWQGCRVAVDQLDAPRAFRVQVRERNVEVDERAWGRPDGRADRCDQRGGTCYAARTTPQMFVVDPAGRIVYAGAIDDKRSTNPGDIKSAKNYVRAALDESMAGRPVTVASTRPYGCSVKY